MYRLRAYLKFLLSSSNHHGVHSPFVFQFVTKCLYDKTHYEAYKKLLLYRKHLLSDKSNIEIDDYGAGSRVFNSNTRSIRDIAKYSGSNFKKTKILFKICNYVKPRTILELGTSLGISTFAFSLAFPRSSITSIEGCSNIATYTINQLRDFKAENIRVVIGRFKEQLSVLKQSKFDILFIDGNHTKEATLQYFETLLQFTHNDTVMIFDDIYWSKEMTMAWEIIKSHKQVMVTIDCFHFGLVFFRKEQAREDFKIRL